VVKASTRRGAAAQAVLGGRDPIRVVCHGPGQPAIVLGLGEEVVRMILELLAGLGVPAVSQLGPGGLAHRPSPAET